MKYWNNTRDIDSLCTKQSYHTDNTVIKKPQWAANFDFEGLIRNFVESGLKYICNLKKKVLKKVVILIVYKNIGK